MHVYCRALHRAIGVEHSDVQERGLIEVWNWITPIVRRYVRDSGQAEACANDVLLTIWQKCTTIRDPGSLLAFSAMTASRAAFRMLREDERYELSLDPKEVEENQNVEETSDSMRWMSNPCIPKVHLPGIASTTRVEQESSQAAFEKLIRRCLRSLAEQEVFIDLVLHDLTVSEVAAKLGITLNNVSVLKNRAKKRSGVARFWWRRWAARLPRDRRSVIMYASSQSCARWEALLPEYVEACCAVGLHHRLIWACYST